MTKITTPHFDFESKKEYTSPKMEVIELKHRQSLLTGSDPQLNIYDETVDEEDIL